MKSSDREIARLYIIEKKTLLEVANILGMGYGKVRYRLNRMGYNARSRQEASWLREARKRDKAEKGR